MTLPFEIAEIHGALALAYKVAEIAFSDVHDAHQQYLDFRQDIEDLTNSLHNLAGAIGQARRGALLSMRPSTATTTGFNHVLGSFTAVLEDCRRLVEHNATYGEHHGPVYNLRWFLTVRDDIDMLRDRIAFLNIKLSVAFKSLEIEANDGTRRLVVGVGELLLRRIDDLESRISRLLGEPLPAEPERTIEIPKPVLEILTNIYRARAVNLLELALSQGIDETIFYLDRATQFHSRRRHTTKPLPEPSQAFKFANIIRAYWTLQATKSTDEYRRLSARVTIEDFETHFPRLGMTVPRYLNKLGESILEAYDALALSGDEAPTIQQVQDILQRERHAWEEHCGWRPRHRDENNPRRGEKILACRLQDASAAEQSLEMWQYDAVNQRQLTLITCGMNRADWIYHIDLSSVQVMPMDDAFSPQNDCYSLFVDPIRNGGQAGFSLAFYGKRGLFNFQQVVTGYKVVDDLAGVRVSIQQASRVIGGSQRIGTCRVQLWSSTVRPTGRSIPREILGSSTSTLRNLPRNNSSTPAPSLPPLANFSRITLSQDSVLTPPTSPSSSTLSIESSYPVQLPPSQSPATGQRSTPSPNNQRHSDNSFGSTFPRNSAFMTPTTNFGRLPTNEFNRISTHGHGNLNRGSSRPLSVLSQSSTSTFSTSTSTPSRNAVQVDPRGNLSVTINSPDPPRLIVFLKGRTQPEPNTLFVIDIDQHVNINPDLCGCRQSGTNARTSSDRRPQESPATCCRVVLQGVSGAYIRAKETDTVPENSNGRNSSTTMWNLASGGRFQDDEEGLTEVKRVTLVTFEFASVEARKSFVEHFDKLKKLYMKLAAVKV
ncbi:hypothetical protein QBC35DRAFT_502847 [Podospora australis]|uniref:Uncharacterized protein n=1 Tax=Podospora australis TaxID=1536484 RepID=A0AAN6WPW6_9PEZI|nr:hypothetical protein QBC35DRAFT_502847 [Podospora australis]